MRVRVGQIVNVDADVNLADLKPLDRIIASAVNAYHNTGIYRRRYAETEERREEQRRKARDALIDSLLSIIYPQLDENQLLRDKDDTCKGILVEVPPRFTKILEEVIESHEFDAYNITVIPPSKLLSKFANPPYLLYISNRRLAR